MPWKVFVVQQSVHSVTWPKLAVVDPGMVTQLKQIATEPTPNIERGVELT